MIKRCVDRYTSFFVQRWGNGHYAYMYGYLTSAHNPGMWLILLPVTYKKIYYYFANIVNI